MELAFKIVLDHAGRKQTKHRFRGDFSYEQLQDFLTHLWGGNKELVVEYTDDEGDQILVLSEPEWRECIHLYLERRERENLPHLPLALRVRKAQRTSKARKSHQHAPHDDLQQVDSDADVQYTTPTEISLESLHNRHMHEVPNTTDHNHNSSRCSRVSVPPLHLSHMRHGRTTVDTESPLEAAILHLLSLLFNVDAAAELMHPSSSPGPMSAVLKRQEGTNSDVHLDIDILALRDNVIVRANQLMDSDPPAARALLDAALAYFTEDGVLFYNHACACALAGATATALASLERAALLNRERYSRSHLLNDKDLIALATLPTFFEFLDRCYPDTPAPAPIPEAARAMETMPPVAVAVVEPPVAVVAPVQPVVPSIVAPQPQQVRLEVPPETPRTTQLQSIFPTLSTGEAKSLLRIANGNLNAAVQWKLGN